MTNSQALLDRFNDVETVVADPLRFKLRLGIGEEAYQTLRIGKRLQQVWDTAGVAAAGAGAAASPVVASTFFASSGGFLSLIGLGTAVTPVGWIIAAAIASGGAYYGVMHVARGYSGSRVETIPKFINTPMDVLAASLFDLLGSLAIRLANIDGAVTPDEREAVARHFVSEWGFDHQYVTEAMAVIEEGATKHTLKDLARTIASFQAENPDCNPKSMNRELVRFLREVAEADGVLDEREDMAIAMVEQILREETELSARNAARAAASWTRKAGTAVKGLGRKLDPLRARLLRAE